MMAALRKWLLAGLLVLVPLAVTLGVLNWVVSTLDQTLDILPDTWHPDKWLGSHVPGLGVILALIIVASIGAVATNFLGRQVMSWWDALLKRIPIVRSIYSGVKQVSDALFSSNGHAFRKALLLQWPQPGIWTIGFLTGVPGGAVTQHLQGDYLSVYVPTTPNPTSGYFVMLKRQDCIELDMSVDQALTYVISMGVVAPSGRQKIHPSH